MKQKEGIMKDYTEFIVDAYDWQANRPRFLIDQLMPNGIGDYGTIGGRWWLGKTNLCLELLFCLAAGDSFFGLGVEQVPVVFLDFEGSPVNISERLLKISDRHSRPPTGYLNVESMRDKRFKLHGNINRMVDEVKGAKLALIDGTKHLIEGEYLKPAKVKSFGEDLMEAMTRGKFSSIITWQIKKPHEDTLVNTGDLFTLKGAADLIEDATFALLLEKEPPRPLGKGTWYHPPGTDVNLYIGKAKEADIEFPKPFKELAYDKDHCEFKDR
jgi:hypothetical protein